MARERGLFAFVVVVGALILVTCVVHKQLIIKLGFAHLPIS
jgi:hypothetical protein